MCVCGGGGGGGGGGEGCVRSGRDVMFSKMLNPYIIRSCC